MGYVGYIQKRAMQTMQLMTYPEKIVFLVQLLFSTATLFCPGSLALMAISSVQHAHVVPQIN